MNDGGPAFPHVSEEEYDSGYHQTNVTTGMSLRDWFAGQALMGLLAKRDYGRGDAEHAYKVADAMLEERQKALDKS